MYFVFFCLFYNWCLSYLQHFTRAIAYVARALAFDACLLVVASRSPQNSGHAPYSESKQDHLNEHVTLFLCIARTIHDSCKIKCKCLRVCCATIRQLLNLTHVILQRFNIIARFIGFSFHALSLVLVLIAN